MNQNGKDFTSGEIFNFIIYCTNVQLPYNKMVLRNALHVVLRNALFGGELQEHLTMRTLPSTTYISGTEKNQSIVKGQISPMSDLSFHLSNDSNVAWKENFFFRYVTTDSFFPTSFSSQQVVSLSSSGIP